MSAVEFRNVHFRIGDRTILNNLNFSIAPGETLVLLGRSGSGKTTALRLINGMILPSSARSWSMVKLRSIGTSCDSGAATAT
jgi:osmoprotectant transport system ATP-binding protein